VADALVVDLSSLWAGPLCGHLLVLAGARVVKLESLERPDGSRRGPAAFFDLLNAGKRSVAIPFGDPSFVRLLGAADLVVDSARPRVWANAGIDPAAVVAGRDATWLSITGYGRTGPWRDRSAFGDDAAVAAGAATLVGDPDGPPMFCADAYADPVTGIHAAVAALAAIVGGGSRVVDVGLRDVVAHLLEGAERHPESDARGLAVAAPRAREPAGQGPALGSDTDAVLASLTDP
jgi:crotonobetainyl-CoA:carnitine CoA-transferase CaiB-like acyl-CoA transferase